MENLIEELRFQNGMESKWKWIGKGMENVFSKPLELKLYGMEWNWNGNGMEMFTTKKIDAKWNGIGMEMEWKFHHKRN